MTKTIGTKQWADHNVNFQHGCENGCIYCYAAAYAIRYKRFPDHAAWSMQPLIDMKRVTKNYKKKEGRIMFPTTHDISLRNMICAGTVLKTMLDAGNQILITTKPHPTVVEYLCTLLYGYKDQIVFRFTITSLDDNVSKFWEPNAPLPRDRILALSYAKKHGFATSVSMEKPFLEDPLPIIKAVRRYVTDSIWVGPMNRVHLKRLGYDSQWEEKLWGAQSPDQNQGTH